MKELNQDSILALLSDIIDPDLHLSLQEVNAIHSVISCSKVLIFFKKIN